MVLGVCRRVLRDWHDAEDAFQATFLVLVHKAATIVPPDLVSNWLYKGGFDDTMSSVRESSSENHAVPLFISHARFYKNLWLDHGSPALVTTRVTLVCARAQKK
jgi:hypothetical protein